MTEAIDVIELLRHDHQQFNRLLDHLDRETQPGDLHRLLTELVDKVAPHEAIEEDIVFPALLALSPDEDRQVTSFVDEHAEINELLEGMKGLDPAGPGFERRASALVLQVRQHFTAEEETIFPHLLAGFGAEERAELGRRAVILQADRHLKAEPETGWPAIVSPEN